MTTEDAGAAKPGEPDETQQDLIQAVQAALAAHAYFCSAMADEWPKTLRDPMADGLRLQELLGLVAALAGERMPTLSTTSTRKLRARLWRMIQGREFEDCDETYRTYLEGLDHGVEKPSVPERKPWRDGRVGDEMKALVDATRVELDTILGALCQPVPESAQNPQAGQPPSPETKDADEWVPIAEAAKRVPGTTKDKIRGWTKRKWYPLGTSRKAGITHVRLGDVRQEAAAPKKTPPRRPLSTTPHDAARRRRGKGATRG